MTRALTSLAAAALVACSGTTDPDDTADSGDTEETEGPEACPVQADHVLRFEVGADDWTAAAGTYQIESVAWTVHAGYVEDAHELDAAPGDTIGVVVELTDPLVIDAVTANATGFYFGVGSQTWQNLLGTGETVTVSNEGSMTLDGPMGTVAKAEGAVRFQAWAATQLTAGETLTCVALTLEIPDSYVVPFSEQTVTISADDRFFFDDFAWSYVESGDTSATPPPVSYQ